MRCAVSGAAVVAAGALAGPASAQSASADEPQTDRDTVIVTAVRNPEDPPVVAEVRERLSETPGAVAVVSGNIKGKTSTMPLYIETLYMEYQSVSAFSLATILSLLALATLLLKNFIEWRSAKSARH